jgi:hypothetical protein
MDWMPEGQTVNQIYYKEVVTTLHEWMRRRPEMWKNSSWVLNQRQHAGTQHPLCQDFLTKHNITMLEHTPY